MIAGDGVACLADFALSGLITDPTIERSESMAASKRNLVRYLAPEQIRPSDFNRENSNASKESDVHCFAMTAYEVRSPASPMRIAEKFTRLLGPHRNPAIRRQQTLRSNPQTHFRQQPSASDRGSMVTRLNLGNDRGQLGLISMGAAPDCRSPWNIFAFSG